MRDHGIEVAEVRRHSEVATLHELLGSEAGPVPVDPTAAHGAAEDQHGGRVSVIRPAVAVLAYGPPKLGHREHDHVVNPGAEVTVERGQPLGEVGEPRGKLAALVALAGM